MRDYTENFSEAHALIGQGNGEAVTTEQNYPSSGFYNVENYHRIAILVRSSIVTTTLDIDVEATNDDGSTVVTLKRAPQLVAADDNVAGCIEIRGEELGYIEDAITPATVMLNANAIRIEVTPSGAATYTILVLGQGRYAPEDTWDWIYATPAYEA